MSQTVRLYAIALATIAVVVACDRVPLTSPTGSTISVSMDRNVLPVNGQATVTAVVTESAGTAVHNGTMVTFQPSIGTVEPREVPTVNGVATSTFFAGSLSGSGVIHAFSGPARTGSGNLSGGGVEVKVGTAAASGTISLSATPPAVSQSGGTVTVSAIVFDGSSNPLPGVQVQFTASNGVLSQTTAVTDASGTARTTLSTTQTTTVTAVAGTAKGEVQVVVSAAPIVTIAAPDTGTAGVPVAITLTPSGGTGTNTSPRQIAQVHVNFGDGTSQTLTNITGQIGLTHTYTREGGYTITATSSDVNGNTGISSKAIVINRQQQPTVSLSAPSSTNVSAPIAVSFSGTAPSGNNAQIVSARVTLQDGTVIYSGTQPNNFNYKFNASGTYTLTGTVTDSNGNTASTSTTVFVSS